MLLFDGLCLILTTCELLLQRTKSVWVTLLPLHKLAWPEIPREGTKGALRTCTCTWYASTCFFSRFLSQLWPLLPALCPHQRVWGLDLGNGPEALQLSQARATEDLSFRSVYVLPEKTAADSWPHVSFLSLAQSWKEAGFPAERWPSTGMQLKMPLFFALRQQSGSSVLVRSYGVWFTGKMFSQGLILALKNKKDNCPSLGFRASSAKLD